MPIEKLRHAAPARDAGHEQPGAEKAGQDVKDRRDHGAEEHSREDQQSGRDLDLPYSSIGWRASVSIGKPALRPRVDPAREQECRRSREGSELSGVRRGSAARTALEDHGRLAADWQAGAKGRQRDVQRAGDEGTGALVPSRMSTRAAPCSIMAEAAAGSNSVGVVTVVCLRRGRGRLAVSRAEDVLQG